MIPSSNADMIIHYDQPVYSGQFSDDGNFFFSVNKDFRVRMYDTSNPYSWRYYKTVEYPFGQWTLTDASLSPDNRYLAYSSIRSTVCLAPTDPNDLGDPYNLDLSDTGNGRIHSMAYRARYGSSFGIWSVRFSGDGREIVAGADDGLIVVYDIESRRTLHRISGHEKDVNAVCFADSSSPHILYSGSDDTTIKVWDTRSMADNREAGAFVGHIEGLTYIDSKGDGREYAISSTGEMAN
jgi:DDB1- and CUL4-associated factor 11